MLSDFEIAQPTLGSFLQGFRRGEVFLLFIKAVFAIAKIRMNITCNNHAALLRFCGFQDGRSVCCDSRESGYVSTK